MTVDQNQPCIGLESSVKGSTGRELVTSFTITDYDEPSTQKLTTQAIVGDGDSVEGSDTLKPPVETLVDHSRGRDLDESFEGAEIDSTGQDHDQELSEGLIKDNDKLEQAGELKRSVTHLSGEDSILDSKLVAEGPVFQPLPSYFLKDFFSTRSHPWNRSGFRYQPCGRVSRLSKEAVEIEEVEKDLNQQKFHLEQELLSQKIFYRTIESPPTNVVRWSWEDRSSYVHITKDGLSITTDRGFRSARANTPIREGKWFFEIILKRAGGEVNLAGRSDPEEAHVRIGIARRESGLNTPVGIDGYSYAIRDKTGEKVHLSRLTQYGEPFGSGDVIGVLVELPDMKKPHPGDKKDPAVIKLNRVPIRYRRQLYFESAEYPVSKEMADLAEKKISSKPIVSDPRSLEASKKKAGKEEGDKEKMDLKIDENEKLSRLDRYNEGDQLPILKGSKLIFFKNGVSQGVAFEDLLDFLPLSSGKLLGSDSITDDFNREACKAEANLSDRLHDDGTLGYYPCVSVYGGGIATLNAGPEFSFAPPNPFIQPSGHPAETDGQLKKPSQTKQEQKSDVKFWRPLCELHSLYLAEQNRLEEEDWKDKNGLKTTEEGEEFDNLAAIKKSSVFKRKRTESPGLPINGPAANAKGGGTAKKKKIKLPTNQEFSAPISTQNPSLTLGEAPKSVTEKSNDEDQDQTFNSNLSILCQVASESMEVKDKDETKKEVLENARSEQTLESIKETEPDLKLSVETDFSTSNTQPVKLSVVSMKSESGIEPKPDPETESKLVD
ncbi:hypothetical protein BY996DRAFT_6414141 [Phakopsora pachyrhizi]|nr:hypothetical protein BY996DRAFT_6414141 [Phakopsora pachyrhizi]